MLLTEFCDIVFLNEVVMARPKYNNLDLVNILNVSCRMNNNPCHKSNK